ncbi:hypothetical protein DU475_19090 [Rhodopseudomonas sp. WA056]|uniref:hypothetical protein n=1 Tax=Rhodopseudomonas sp. WA056 TaxID=2269367 RepID=UPI0013DF6C54|nr:hypothetical protein [Rhodopseudomonas sp. WA056]NEW89353.1 hypothetical protein [Rhodopseudomonas sp. WA056]
MKPRLPLLLIPAGFVIWASAFTLLYAALSLGCVAGWQSEVIAGMTPVRLVLLVVWLVHLAALIVLLIYCVHLRHRSADRTFGFLRRAAIGSTVAALAATVWTGVAIPAVTPCL